MKINLRQEPAVKKRGGAKTDRVKERKRKSPGKQFSLAQAGSSGSLRAPLFTHRENFGQFHSSPFSGH